MMRKEAEFHRAEIAKERKESELLRRQLEVAHMKCEVVYGQMLKNASKEEKMN